MKLSLAFFTLLIVRQCFAQCPYPVTIKSTGGVCLGSTLFVAGNPSDSLLKIVWYNGDTIDTAITAVKVALAKYGITVAGGNGRGAAANQLNFPNSVFVDANGSAYVSDITNYRIQKFPQGSTSLTNGITVAGGNGLGSAANQIQPNSVYVDGNGYLYAADNAGARILKFPPNSNKNTSGITVAGGNGQGTAPNQFVNPVSIDEDAAGNMYVIDAQNNRLQEFPPNSTGSTNAITIAGSHGYGPGANQFNGPACVHVDSIGNIFVADAANNRIQKFAPGATDAVTVAGGNGFGRAANQLSTPSSVWVDGAGFIYVADVNNERIQKFPPGSTSATLGKTVAGGNGAGNGPNQFSGPNSVCVDAAGNIYVSDAGNNRIQKFSQGNDSISVIDTVYIPTAPGTYTAVVTNNYGCADTTNAITIIPAVRPTVSISATGSRSVSCLGQALDTLSFAAAISYGGTAPAYQWQVNGIAQGTDDSFFTAALAAKDIVTCTLTSNAACALIPSVTSSGYSVPVAGQPVITLSSKGNFCAGSDTLIINSSGRLSAIIWYNGNIIDTTITSLSTSNGSTIDTAYIPAKPGSYTAIVTSTAGCTHTTDAVIISQTQTSVVKITAAPSTVCAGSQIAFTAAAANAGQYPTYQWLINSAPAGTNSPVYTTSSLSDGDVIACAVTGGPGCFATSVSNSIVATIWPTPIVGAGGNISISPGQSITLNMPVTGNVVSYLWQPPTGLSSNTVANPDASPAKTTTYALKVTTANGCTATGQVTVLVLSAIYVPGAFTPNADGHNDIFYVIGGKAGDNIRDFSVYGRSGQKLFHVQNAPPGDPGFGWNGSYNGFPQPAGTYVYIAVVSSADGTEKIYKGTVVLVR